MLGIKKLHIYIIRSFLVYFFMTFFIAELILMMQFVWKELPNLIGKGLGFEIFAEFLMYVSLMVVPMALPLAILLASLMNFGNMGEHFELTAMKSAGVSLFRIMRGLIIFISFLSVGAFFFSNNVLPVAQQKLWTLIFSIRQKAPETEIPEGEFYKGIDGYNIYVREKDPDKGLLKELMIYDFSSGFDNATVMLADSGRVQFTTDNKYLKFSLYSGESFENLSRSKVFSPGTTSIPYRREIFEEKHILLDLDTEFTRYDESILKDQHVSKNITQLNQTIDSVSKIVAMRGEEQAQEMMQSQFQPLKRALIHSEIMEEAEESEDGEQAAEEHKQTDRLIKEEAPPAMIPLKGEKGRLNDTLFRNMSHEKMTTAVSIAKRSAGEMRDKVEFNRIMLNDPTMVVRRHQIEWHKKFTLSFACLVFFFIGAPLGALIRKGGLGFPIVVSVLLFVIYYIIDTTGYKMAREGLWAAHEGMWLSSAVLFPLGMFLTWKAVTDASIFRSENYIILMDKFRKKLKNIFTHKADKAESRDAAGI